MAAPCSNKNAPYWRQMPQRTWRWWIKNIIPLQARESIPLCTARDKSRPSHSTGTSSQGHNPSDLQHNKWTPDAPSGRSQVQRTGTSAIARSLHSTLDTTTNASWLLWRRFLVTHIELSWYQRSLPINHYYHRHLIGLALCYCRFVHLYCYIRTACRGPLKYAFSTFHVHFGCSMPQLQCYGRPWRHSKGFHSSFTSRM